MLIKKIFGISVLAAYIRLFATIHNVYTAKILFKKVDFVFENVQCTHGTKSVNN